MLNSSIAGEGIRPLTPPERLVWEWFYDIHNNSIEQMSYEPALYDAEQRFTVPLKGGLVNRAYRNRAGWIRIWEGWKNPGMQAIMELGRCVQSCERPPKRPVQRL